MTGVIVSATLGFMLPQAVLYVAAGTLSVVAAAWHISGLRTFPGGRHDRHANRAWAHSGRVGQLYFGALMGAGLFTQMSTPLIYPTLLLSAAGSWKWVLAAGVGFGLGRSGPAVAGALLAERHLNAHSVFLAMTRPRVWPLSVAIGASFAILTVALAGLTT